jgi:cell division transport system permease protein
MIALLRYSIGEAGLSLVRGWRSALLAIAIIAAAVFITGAVLLVSINVDRILVRLSATAELTIYLKPGDAEAERAKVAETLAQQPAVTSSQFVGGAAALDRFKRELPDLAALVGALDENPLPSAFEVRLRDGVTEADTERLVQALTATGAVEDVRYDRRIFDRLIGGLDILRQGGAMLAIVIVFAAIVTITSVLRLAYLTRRDETAVLFLLGVPPSAIRGPFVVEGLLQTLAGGVAAILALWVAFGAVEAQVGAEIAQAFGTGGAVFLSRGMQIGLVVASGAVGALAGLVAAWKEP